MIKVLDNRNAAAKEISLNTIAGWFNETNKTNVSIQTLFREEGWLRRCVDIRANAVASIPWTITTTSNDNPVWTSDEPVAPDNLQFVSDLPTLLYKWSGSLSTTGAAYSLKEQGARAVDSLFYFNPLNIEPVKTESAGIVGYKRTVNTKIETYSADDVVAMFAHDPFVEAGPGASIGNAARANAQVLRAMTGFLNKFLDQGLIKATILSVDGGEYIPEDQITKLGQLWNKTLGGWFRGGRQAVFNSKVTPHTIGEGLGDLTDNDMTQEQREAVAVALGVPITMLTKSDAFATKRADQVDFYLFTAIPEGSIIARALNAQLLNEMGFTFRFEPKKIEVLQQHELEKAQAVTQIVGAPVLTVDEGRELLNYDPLPFDDDDDVGDGVLTSEQVQEVMQWRRRVKNTKSRQARFDTEHLRPEQVAVIRSRLETEMPLNAVFSAPFASF